MNRFYKKINLNFLDVDYSKFKGDKFREYETSSLCYYYINDKESLKKILPKQIFNLPCQFKFVELTESKIVPPHRDYDLYTSINFYFNPGTAITLWYTEKANTTEITNHNERSRVYNIKDLNLVDRFVALKNDVFVFNNSEIHAVDKRNNSLRQFIQIQYNNSFDEVVESISFNYK